MEMLLPGVREARDVIMLGEALLQRCRRDAATLKVAKYDDVLRVRRNDLLHEASALFKDFGAALLAQVDRGRVVDLVVSYADLPLALVARTLADALDERLGKRMFGTFKAGGERRLRAGGAVAVPASELDALRRLHARPLIAPPWRLSDDLDGMRNLRLLPNDVGPFSVELGLRDGAPLCSLRAGDRVAVGVVNHDFVTELEDMSPVPGRIFPVVPRHQEEQSRRLLSVLQLAESEGIRLLVLPELCWTPELRTGIEEHLAPRMDKHGLIVIGSGHLTECGVRRNRSVAHSAAFGARSWVHDKMERYTDADGKEEDIEPASRLQVCYVGEASFVTLICKDFFHLKVQEVLREVRPSFVFVSALSNSSTNFWTTAKELVQRTQATVLVANTPHHALESEIRALVVTPRKDDVPSPLYAQCQGVGLAVHEFGGAQQELRWVPVSELE